MTLAYSLFLYARGDEQKTAQLKAWQTAALESIAQNKGKDLVSSSANGISVSFASGMSVNDWFSTLTTALAYLSNGGKVTRTRGGLV